MASRPDGPTGRGIVSQGALRIALAFSWAALLAYFARSMIDFRDVYPDQMPETASNWSGLALGLLFAATLVVDLRRRRQPRMQPSTASGES